MITVNVHNGDLTAEEKQAYMARAHELFPGVPIDCIDIALDGDYADVTYNFGAVRFQRIRRITGYLVGTLDRFNDAKRSEVGDRVKHDVSEASDRHGKWIARNDGWFDFSECSVCGQKCKSTIPYDRCPGCGAKMDSEST